MARKLDPNPSGQGFGVPGVQLASFPSTYTVCGWLYQHTAVSGCIFTMSNAAVTQYSRVEVSASGPGNLDALWNDGGGQVGAGTGGGALGQWFHFAAALTQFQRTVYRNGVVGGNAVSFESNIVGTTETGIGHVPSNAFRDSDCSYAHIAIYNTTLTSRDVASLAQGVSPLNYRADRLIHYWPGNGTGNLSDVVSSPNQLDLAEEAGPIATVEEPFVSYAPIVGRNMINP